MRKIEKIFFLFLEKILGILCKICKNQKKTLETTMFYRGYHLAENWENVKKIGTFYKFFEDNYIQRIAIYGFGEIGQRLYHDIKQIDVSIVYIIDKKLNNTQIDAVPIVDINDKLDEVDVIIVTPVQMYDEIALELEMRTNISIISLMEIVEYCL